jgi:hypothetical protein
MTVSLSPMGKYQLVVLGPEGNAQVRDCASRLDNAVNLSFNQLGVNPSKFLIRVMSGTQARNTEIGEGPPIRAPLILQPAIVKSTVSARSS